MSDDPTQPVVLPYATRPNPWARLLAMAGVAAAVLFILMIVPLGAMGFRMGRAGVVILAPPLVALALGLAARARSSRDDLDTRGRARWAIVLGVAELLILLAAALPMKALWRSQETANRVKCQSQIRALGQAILLYSNDNRGQWPPTIDVLVTDSDATAEVFICPSSNDVPAPGATGVQQAAAMRANRRHCSYVYAAPTMRFSRFDSSPRAEGIVAYESLVNHGDGINVLFGDGHVEWLNLNEANHLLAELQAGRNPPRPMPAAPTVTSAPVLPAPTSAR